MCCSSSNPSSSTQLHGARLTRRAEPLDISHKRTRAVQGHATTAVDIGFNPVSMTLLRQDSANETSSFPSSLFCTKL